MKAYMIMNKKGKPIIDGSKLPIYWYKKIAKKRMGEYANSKDLKIKTIKI